MKRKTKTKKVKSGLVLSDGLCWNCNGRTGHQQFCYGCKSYICPQCEAPQILWDLSEGKHTPDLHLCRIIKLERGMKLSGGYNEAST